MAGLNKLLDIGMTVGGFVPVVSEVLDVASLAKGIVTGNPIDIITSIVGLVTPGVSGGQLKFGRQLVNQIGMSGADDAVRIGKKALSKMSDTDVANLSKGQLSKSELQKAFTEISSESRLRKRSIKKLSDTDFEKAHGYSRDKIKQEMDDLIGTHGTSARFKNLNQN